MSLKKYHQKRDFKKTPEPKGQKPKPRTKKLRYLIQKHAASHLHYDFRIEMEGVLKSWAVPKGPSLDPTVKRLAVHVEDHPLEYGKFEGVIPAGEYGGGTVMLWDEGTWEEEGSKGYKTGNLKILLQGEKLKGEWKLIQIKKDPKNWLLIKGKDEYARAEKEYAITTEETLSVTTNRSLKEIQAQEDKVWAHGKANKQNKKSSKTPTQKIKFPQVSPQLATLVDKAPVGDNWLHEVKFDGYRLLAQVDNEVHLITRGQQDWTDKFPQLAKELKQLKLTGTLLDGEVVALDENKRSNFQALQNALQEGSKAPLVYYVFDIIYFKGEDLTELPLLERKKILTKILTPAKIKNLGIRYSDHIIGNGQAVFDQAARLGLEGIIAKDIHSTYVQKRAKNWLKVKSSARQEFVIVGYTKPQGSRSYFGSLLLGFYDKKKKLQYCGHVGTGFNEKTLKTIYTQLQAHKITEKPFSNKAPVKNVASWVEPNIVIEVEFLEWTSDGMLRHPSFKGIRMDKSAKKITRDEKKSILTVKKAAKPEKVAKSNHPITHPERILYPGAGITKQNLADYYTAVSQWMLPYIINRPLTLLRCPQGQGKSCFYQRHLTKNQDLSKGLFTIDTHEKNAKEEYVYIKNLAGLIQLVQMGALEIHPWGGKTDKIDNPDILIFDLDPGTDVPWKDVVGAALDLKKELENYHLQSFVKTTGGKGLHVVIPIQRRYDWDETVNFSKVFVQYMVQKNPTKYIGTMSKAKRQGKIFIDYLRNHRGATAIAPYSTRARENAPVATPLNWQELTPKIKSDQFTVKNVLARLNKIDDPWQDFFKVKQGLPK